MAHKTLFVASVLLSSALAAPVEVVDSSKSSGFNLTSTTSAAVRAPYPYNYAGSDYYQQNQRGSGFFSNLMSTLGGYRQGVNRPAPYSPRPDYYDDVDSPYQNGYPGGSRGINRPVPQPAPRPAAPKPDLFEQVAAMAGPAVASPKGARQNIPAAPPGVWTQMLPPPPGPSLEATVAEHPQAAGVQVADEAFVPPSAKASSAPPSPGLSAFDPQPDTYELPQPAPQPIPALPFLPSSSYVPPYAKGQGHSPDEDDDAFFLPGPFAAAQPAVPATRPAPVAVAPPKPALPAFTIPKPAFTLPKPAITIPKPIVIPAPLPVPKAADAITAPAPVVAVVPAAQEASRSGSGGVWQPAVGAKYQIILSEPIEAGAKATFAGKTEILPADTQIFDIDLFDNDADEIERMHKAGKKVICYFSAGTWEKARPDTADYPAAIKGSGVKRNDFGAYWDELWLDIRNPNPSSSDLPLVWKLMKTRIELAAQKGCDAIDPDNMDAFDPDNSPTGFPITRTDSINYIKFMSETAGSHNMSIGLKNAIDILPDVQDYIHFAVNEQCVGSNECGRYHSFLNGGNGRIGKPVFHIEYIDDDSKGPSTSGGSTAGANRNTDFTGRLMERLCMKNDGSRISSKFSTVIKEMELGGWVQFCDGSQVTTSTKGKSGSNSRGNKDGKDSSDSSDASDASEGSYMSSASSGSSGSSSISGSSHADSEDSYENSDASEESSSSYGASSSQGMSSSSSTKGSALSQLGSGLYGLLTGSYGSSTSSGSRGGSSSSYSNANRPSSYSGSSYSSSAASPSSGSWLSGLFSGFGSSASSNTAKPSAPAATSSASSGGFFSGLSNLFGYGSSSTHAAPAAPAAPTAAACPASTSSSGVSGFLSGLNPFNWFKGSSKTC